MAYYDGELIKENYAKRLNQVDGIMITTADASVLLSLSIYETPTAEVAEVKHGYWIEVNHTGNSKRGRHIKYTTKKCSVCGYCNGRRKTKRCPNCGAIMDGGRSI